MSTRVLVVEDDPIMSDMLCLYLEREGYLVTVARDGAAGLSQAHQNPFDLVLLDLMLPGLHGYEVCRILRERSGVPIILLTALDQEMDKVRGLDMGADDYVTKPFAVQELLARVRARVRRRDPHLPHGTNLLIFPGLQIDIGSRSVRLQGQPVSLSPKEFDLLVSLAREPGRVFDHDTLVQMVWQSPPGIDDHTLRTHILRLRRKLGELGARSLRTVWGSGYQFQVDAK